MGLATYGEDVDGLPLTWSVVARPLEGQELSGDAYVAVRTRTGMLVAVIDGLGHGPEAHQASRVIADAMEQRPEDSVGELFQVCHRAARRTRGAALTILRLEATPEARLTWAGVGNVDAVVVRRGERHRLLVNGGVVGFRLPNIRVSTLALREGDLIVVATDGLGADFAEAHDLARPANMEPAELASSVFAASARGTDDALVFVGRWGRNP